MRQLECAFKVSYSGVSKNLGHQVVSGIVKGTGVICGKNNKYF